MTGAKREGFPHINNLQICVIIITNQINIEEYHGDTCRMLVLQKRIVSMVKTVPCSKGTLGVERDVTISKLNVT